MNKRVGLKIIGNVQGVFYRVKTQEKAIRLNLTGYVKNENNGAVSIIAEGDAKNLEKLINWCWEGSSSASVRDINIKWKPYKKEFNNFEIKY